MSTRATGITLREEESTLLKVSHLVATLWGGRLRDEDSGDCLPGESLMIQRVGDRDKIAFSIKPYAFTIASNPMSDRLQKVIEIKYEDNE